MEQKIEKSKQLAKSKQKKGAIKAKTDFFRTARYGLTLQEHRIIYFAILKGQQNNTPFEPVTISILEFKEMCDLKGESSYSALRTLTKKILTKSVEVVYKDDKGVHIMQAPWLTGITYHTKEGTVTIELNKKVQPFFEGKPFTNTEFFYLVKFTCQYSERLYELIKSLSFKPSIDFDIEELRKHLAIATTQYTNYNMFRTRVLDPAVKDINEYTDLEVVINEKRGRYNKVESVVFGVRKKTVPKLSNKNADLERITPPLSDEQQEALLNDLLGSEDQDEYVSFIEEKEEVNFAEVFWNSYPKKVGKGEITKWFKVNPTTEEEFDKMLAAIKKQKQSKQWQDEKGRFIPKAINWLNSQGWLDELEGSQSNVITNDNKELLKQLHQQSIDSLDEPW